MYRVRAIEKYVGSCMIYDVGKTFLTRFFFAKRYYTKLCKTSDMVVIEEKFGDEWVELSFHTKRTTGYVGNTKVKKGRALDIHDRR